MKKKIKFSRLKVCSINEIWYSSSHIIFSIHFYVKMNENTQMPLWFFLWPLFYSSGNKYLKKIYYFCSTYSSAYIKQPQWKLSKRTNSLFALHAETVQFRSTQSSRNKTHRHLTFLQRIIHNRVKNNCKP